MDTSMPHRNQSAVVRFGNGSAMISRHRTPPTMGILADTLAASLQQLAQSDARLYRGLDQHLRTSRRLLAEDSAIAGSGDLDGRIAAAIALLEAHGYTVTR
jgi:hypothetical protein